MSRATQFSLLVLCFACASPGLERFPYCEASEKPMLAVDTCDSADVAKLRMSIRTLLEQDLRTGQVRIEFDGKSRIEGICVVRGYGTGSWRTRRALADAIPTIDALPPGPECVADHRLELNRYQAKLSQIKRSERECRRQVDTTISTNRNSGMALGQVTDREFENCMAFKADWVMLNRGLQPPLIFGEPQLGPPPSVSPRETVNRCVRQAQAPSLKTQAECILEDGWELIR